MKRLNVTKLLFIALPCFALAAVLALQALSIISTRKSPEFAATTFFANGLAQEQWASRLFQTYIANGLSHREAARKVAPIARIGLASDPLAPKSYALLALLEDNKLRREQALGYAGEINRRDITLQGLILERHIEAKDVKSFVNTLDQLLRVHPDQDDTFFPLLLDALKIEKAALEFPRILTGEAPWHEEFLLFAVRDRDAQTNLAKIRKDIGVEHDGVDQQLIAGLAGQGQVAEALAIYELKTGIGGGSSSNYINAWASKYPPFDWYLEEQRDFRSQPSFDGQNLEIYARSGKGGPIARRIVQLPLTPFQISTEFSSNFAGRSNPVRLLLRCNASAEAQIDEELSPGVNFLYVENIPENCSQAILEIRARSLRGEPTLRAELTAIEIEPL